MQNRISRYFFLFQSMGPSYWIYRLYYELMKRTPLFLWSYPKKYKKNIHYQKSDWARSSAVFFFDSKETLTIPKSRNSVLQREAVQITEGKLKYFNGATYDVGISYDWLTDPQTGIRYSAHAHWSKIPDFNKGVDIKNVWEKSRFCYLYTIIRYDYHFEKDCAEFVFSEIMSWINHAPLNCGPNYISSQEIAIRLLNWCFALHYYKNSASLTEERFQKIILSIDAQATHIEKNLRFSQLLVRNNHILSESAALFIVSILFPFLPGSERRQKKGKSVFEKETVYQVFGDGTYLQYSMNYNRVVIQLFTWFIRISELNHIPVQQTVRYRAVKTLEFMHSCTNTTTGCVPNYGANDGSLFFPLNNNSFTDYRPQLQSLGKVLNHEMYFAENFEDLSWYGYSENKHKSGPASANLSLHSFAESGYYLIKDGDSQTFIRCGSHLNRPSQADNLHIDLWVGEQNIMRDAGTYRYNCEQELIEFYFGTSSHNTIKIDNYDQMLKGGRFIWYYWSRSVNATFSETSDTVTFTGSIRAFRQTGAWVTHERKVIRKKNKLHWEIEDSVMQKNHLPVTQIWNPSEYFYEHFQIEAWDEADNRIEPAYQTGYYSETYGVKEETKQILFSTTGKKIKTIITEKI